MKAIELAEKLLENPESEVKGAYLEYLGYGDERTIAFDIERVFASRTSSGVCVLSLKPDSDD